jgi:outer membrane protein TolC
MVKKYFWTLFISSPLVALFFSPAFGQNLERNSTMTLSQRKVAELLLKQSYVARETIYQYDLINFNLSEFLGKFDWGLRLEVGQTDDRTQDFQSLDNNNRIQRLDTQFLLSKLFLSGTQFSFRALRGSRRATFDVASSQSVNSGDATADLLGVRIEQDMLYNAFGAADRARRREIQNQIEASKFLRTSELQNKVLDAVKQFWKTYVAQENFKEAIAARERYEKLVQFIQRKSGLGYARPGELSQIQAELEARNQSVKSTSSYYLMMSDQLLALLNLPRSSEIRFDVSSEIEPPPELKNGDVENLRPLKAQKLSVRSAEESLLAAQSESFPRLAFVGELNQSGYDRDSSSSLAETTSGNNPKYYVGAKIEYTFGSGLQSEKSLNRKLKKLLEDTKLERQRREISNLLDQTERQVQSSYQIAISAKKQKEFRDRFVKEMTTTYNQGRTDLPNYIEALNFYYSSVVNLSEALGNYQIALNEWAAARDELIPNDSSESEIK